MNILIYDNSFAGFLTAVFEVYEYKFTNPVIRREAIACNTSLFGSTHQVHTHADKAARVIKKLQVIFSHECMRNIYITFLSEEIDIENILFRFIQKSLQRNASIEDNLVDKDAMCIKQIKARVSHEAHRMKGFIRFQATSDQLFFAMVEPDFNVLPLISTHFKKRFLSQYWLIYDVKRKYGIYHDLHHVTEVQIENYLSQNAIGIPIANDQMLYEKLWKSYFKSTNNLSRKNTRLHIQMMPKKYWKYLTEKIDI